MSSISSTQNALIIGKSISHYSSASEALSEEILGIIDSATINDDDILMGKKESSIGSSILSPHATEGGILSGFSLDDDNDIDRGASDGGDSIHVTRVDTLHADIEVPAEYGKCGETVSVLHDGDHKQIKIPENVQGQSFRVKMIKKPKEESSEGMFACGYPAVMEDEGLVDDRNVENFTYDDLPCKRVDTLHADIQVPTSAKPGDILTVSHDGEKKQIKVPHGTSGKSIRVKMTKPETQVSTGFLCFTCS